MLQIIQHKHNMGTYTGVAYTKIPTKPSVIALQFSTSDLISYINIILGVVKMWDLREYNTLCLGHPMTPPP